MAKWNKTIFNCLIRFWTLLYTSTSHNGPESFGQSCESERMNRQIQAADLEQWCLLLLLPLLVRINDGINKGESETAALYSCHFIRISFWPIVTQIDVSISLNDFESIIRMFFETIIRVGRRFLYLFGVCVCVCGGYIFLSTMAERWGCQSGANKNHNLTSVWMHQALASKAKIIKLCGFRR